MSRLTSAAALLAALVLHHSAASAQSQAEIASRLNDEGKEAMYGNNYAEATAKFRQAIARVPEPKYFFNLCTSLFQEGKFGEAVAACEAVDKNNPTPDLTSKTAKLEGRIKEEAKAQGLDANALGGGGGATDCNTNPSLPGCAAPPATCQTDPNLPECRPAQPPQQQIIGRPPTGAGVFASTTPDNKYVWTLGADIFGGAGQIGQKDAYGTAAFGFRVKSDFLFQPQQRIGAQAYVQYSKFTQGQEQAGFGVPTLDVVDIGAAVYKHLCVGERLCLTPLVGAHLSLMSPEFDEDPDGTKLFNYAAVGGRAEIGLEYAFGARFENVLTLAGGANVYSAAFSGPSDGNVDGFLTAEEVGLDQGGVVGYFGIGYTHRFNTPLGSSPFITLE
ncbi:MAG: hypothetical protein ABI867_37955 [Kofleriaceae bacterium]